MNVYLFPALKMTPGLIESAFDRLPESAWDSPTAPDRFSPREILAHLADWEPIMQARMVQCAESPGTILVPYDEAQMAIDNGYSHWDPKQSLAKYKQARTATVTWLEALEPDEWRLSAVHPERGELSIYDQANLLVCHDVYHIEQLSHRG